MQQSKLAKIWNVRKRGKVSWIRAYPRVKLQHSALISQNQNYGKDQKSIEKFTFLQTKNLTHIGVWLFLVLFSSSLKLRTRFEGDPNMKKTSLSVAYPIKRYYFELKRKRLSLLSDAIDFWQHLLEPGLPLSPVFLEDRGSCCGDFFCLWGYESTNRRTVLHPDKTLGLKKIPELVTGCQMWINKYSCSSYRFCIQLSAEAEQFLGFDLLWFRCHQQKIFFDRANCSRHQTRSAPFVCLDHN